MRDGGLGTQRAPLPPARFFLFTRDVPQGTVPLYGAAELLPSWSKYRVLKLFVLHVHRVTQWAAWSRDVYRPCHSA